jgi:hypothetical protein
MTAPNPRPMMAHRLAYQDDARTLVMQVLQDAVNDGDADWQPGADDGMECHLYSGEVFLVTEAGVTRLR